MRVFVLLILGILFLPIAQAEAACGKFVVVKGDIQVDFAKEKKKDRARVGTEVCAGDSIKAGADSRAKIVMVDSNELNISPDTVMKIAAYDYKPEEDKKKVLLDVLKGKVRSTVKQKYDGQASTYQVRTKAAVAGVRGTDFIASFDPKAAKFEVVTFEGKVEVGQINPSGGMSNSVFVPAGQMTEVNVGKTPEPPRAVPASELKQMDSNSQAATPSSNASDQASNTPSRDGDKGEKKDGDKKSDKQPVEAKDNSGKKDSKEAKGPKGSIDPVAPKDSSASNETKAPTDSATGQPLPQPGPSRDTASVPPPSTLPPPMMFDRGIDCVTCGTQPQIDAFMPPPPPMMPYMPPPMPTDTVKPPDFMNQIPQGNAKVNVIINTGP